MKKTLLALLLALGFQSWAITPVFKECLKNEKPADCSAARLKVFQKSTILSIQASLGYAVQDSLYFKFSIDDKGQPHVRESFAMVSALALSYAEKALDSLAPLLVPTKGDELYEWGFLTDLPKKYADYLPLEEVKHFPELERCDDFNQQGKMGCFRYLVYSASHKVKQESEEENAKIRVFLHKGSVVAVEAIELPLSKVLADKVALEMEVQLEKLATLNSRKNSGDMYVDMDFHYTGDSLARWNKTMQRLDYLKTLQQQDLFINGIMSAKSEFYRKTPVKGNQFILQQLKTVGLDTAKILQVGNYKYDLDSLRNYEVVPRDKEGATLNFAMVESVPIYKGCKEFKGSNDKLKDCFQHKLLSFVAQNFNFPEEARQNGIQGKVYVGFVIERDGSIGAIEVVRGANILLDLEAIRVISEIPDMDQAAMQRGKAVRMSFTLPINASLK